MGAYIMLPQEIFWHLHTPRQFLAQSEANILIELLKICFIDNIDLVLWLTSWMNFI